MFAGLQVHVGHEEGLVLEDATSRLMTIRRNVFQVAPASCSEETAALSNSPVFRSSLLLGNLYIMHTHSGTGCTSSTPLL